MARIPELRARLVTATDQLNASIRTAETVLAGLHLGVYAEVALPYDRPGWTQALVFAKEHKEWRLLIETGPTDGEVDVVPLVNASRELRVTAVDYLPALASALLATAEEEVSRVGRSTEGVQVMIAKWEQLK